MIQNGFQTSLPEVKPTTEISIFTGELSDQVIFSQIKKLKIAFPEIQPEWTEILIKRIRANNFTDSRLISAIENVIDKFPYKKLNIADIINFDVKVKFYYHEEILGKVADGEDSFDNYVVIDAGIGKPVRVKREDFVRYKFKEWK